MSLSDRQWHEIYRLHGLQAGGGVKLIRKRRTTEEEEQNRYRRVYGVYLAPWYWNYGGPRRFELPKSVHKNHKKKVWSYYYFPQYYYF